MDRLRSTYSNGSEESVDSLLHWYYGHSLILLDDLGAEKSNDGVDGYVAEQITKIWDNHPWWLVISTNKTQREMAQKLGDRLASRLYSGNPDLDEMMLVVNTAEDYRA
jgi:DNA replication protein DnaC